MEQPKAIIYCRVSSDRQVKEGHGLDSQEQRCMNYSKGKGYRVVNIFRDEGVSGALLERPAMKELMGFLDKNPFDKYIIIFDDLSRFARDIETHYKLRTSISVRNATIECVNYKIEDNPEGKFIETILAGKAQLDREQNKRTVMQRMKARMERGYWCLCPPTGMAFIKTPEHGKLLSLKEPEASVIKEALEGFASGKLARQVDVQRFLQANASILNKQKVHLQFVKRVLTQVLYTGHLEYAPWEIKRCKGHHEGFISIELFDKISNKLKRPEKKLHSTDSVQFPLRRLVTCSACGKKMTGSRNKGKYKYYSNYTCNNAQCAAKPKNISKKVLEDTYEELLKKVTPKKEVIALAKAIASDSWNSARKNMEMKNRSSQSMKQKKEVEIETLLEFIPKASNETVRLRYEQRVEDLSGEIEEINRSTLNDKDVDFEEALVEVLDFVGTPLKYWKKTDMEGKHMLHSLIFSENLAYNAQDGFGTPKVSLPFQLNSQLGSVNKVLVEMAGVEPASKKLARHVYQHSPL